MSAPNGTCDWCGVTAIIPPRLICDKCVHVDHKRLLDDPLCRKLCVGDEPRYLANRCAYFVRLLNDPFCLELCVGDEHRYLANRCADFVQDRILERALRILEIFLLPSVALVVDEYLEHESFMGD